MQKKESLMKKFLLWTTSILLTPIVLFLVATLLLYIPSVQNYIVQKAVGYLSEATGADVSVERVTLSFPLDLRVDRKSTRLNSSHTS